MTSLMKRWDYVWRDFWSAPVAKKGRKHFWTTCLAGQHLALRVDHPQGPLCQFRDILARPLQEHQGKLLQMKSPMRVMNDPLIINSNCLHVFFSFITTVHLNLTPNVLSKLWLDYSNITHFLLVGLFSYTWKENIVSRVDTRLNIVIIQNKAEYL